MEEYMDNQTLETMRQEILRGRVVEEVFRGLVVDCEGRLYFLPQSQISDEMDVDLSEFIGQEIDVVQLNMPPRQVRGYGELPLVSHKVAEAEEDHEAARHIQVGDVFEGTVYHVDKNIASVYILPNVKAYLLKDNLSWDMVDDATKYLHDGQKITVTVTKVKRNQAGDIKEIKVGLRELTTSPWVEFAKTAREGDVVTGVIKSKKNFGLFVRLPNGVEGLIHYTELSYNHKPTTEEYQVGETVTAQIKEIDWEQRRLQLSLKALLTDPWESGVEERYSIGQLVAGTITHMNSKGIYLKIEEGVTGLIPKSKLREKVSDFKPQHQIGDLVCAAITKIIKDSRLVILTNKITIEGA